MMKPIAFNVFTKWGPPRKTTTGVRRVPANAPFQNILLGSHDGSYWRWNFALRHGYDCRFLQYVLRVCDTADQLYSDFHLQSLLMQDRKGQFVCSRYNHLMRQSAYLCYMKFNMLDIYFLRRHQGEFNAVYCQYEKGEGFS